MRGYLGKSELERLRRLAFFAIAFVSIRGSSESAGNTREPIAPLPAAPMVSERAILGRRLFSDPRFSKDNTVSYANCHSLGNGGVDGRSHAVGIRSQVGGVNSPSVFNSGFNFRQFWDGRAATLEDQLDGPVTNSIEMNSSWEEIREKLVRGPDIQIQFQQSYSDGLTIANIKNAIATFERALVTPNARIDRYLQGEKNAITNQERRGYEMFKSFGCISCHQGMNVGGNMYQTMGVMGDYFKDRGTPITKSDLGKFNVTNREEDRHVFRVPSLRNVALTAPYFHDGSVSRLDDAVRKMAHYQLGKDLSREEVESIVAFLKTLTGEVPAILRLDSREPDK